MPAIWRKDTHTEGPLALEFTTRGPHPTYLEYLCTDIAEAVSQGSAMHVSRPQNYEVFGVIVPAIFWDRFEKG
jgi:hypothetical protein